MALDVVVVVDIGPEVDPVVELRVRARPVAGARVGVEDDVPVPVDLDVDEPAREGRTGRRVVHDRLVIGEAVASGDVDRVGRDVNLRHVHIDGRSRHAVGQQPQPGCVDDLHDIPLPGGEARDRGAAVGEVVDDRAVDQVVGGRPEGPAGRRAAELDDVRGRIHLGALEGRAEVDREVVTDEDAVDAAVSEAAARAAVLDGLAAREPVGDRCRSARDGEGQVVGRQRLRVVDRRV